MEEAQHATIERSVEKDQTLVKIRGSLDRQSAPGVLDWIQVWLPHEKVQIGLDLSEIEYLDSAGVAVLAETLQLANKRGCRLKLVKVSKTAHRTLDLFRFKGDLGREKEETIGLFERLGNDLLHRIEVAKEVVLLMADTFYWAIVGPFSSLRGAPKGELTRQTILLGSRAFGIITLLAFLIGITMALLSAHQLRQFGANIYAANLVAIAMAREMGPMMTAIIVAGRSGSAIAAEIATMKVTEEVDALEAMGFSPVRFLVVPKLYAVSLTQPLLTALSIAFGIFGGMLIGTIALGIGPQAFLHQAGQALVAKDIIVGLIKSIVFGWTILVVAATCGLDTQGGAEAVGLSTTRSVVVAIFSVIVVDLIFSLVLYT
jgi:phospholipid/cholesterol/gamma-HCH transport system permease protein